MTLRVEITNKTPYFLVEAEIMIPEGEDRITAAARLCEIIMNEVKAVAT